MVRLWHTKQKETKRLRNPSFLMKNFPHSRSRRSQNNWLPISMDKNTARTSNLAAVKVGVEII